MSDRSLSLAIPRGRHGCLFEGSVSSSWKRHSVQSWRLNGIMRRCRRNALTDSAIASSSANLKRLDCLCWFLDTCLFRGAPLETLVAAPAPKLPEPPVRLWELSALGERPVCEGAGDEA